jgi:hypothetical protein
MTPCVCHIFYPFVCVCVCVRERGGGGGGERPTNRERTPSLWGRVIFEKLEFPVLAFHGI